MPTHDGTHHFRTETDAQRYYATYGNTLAHVREKIKEGLIVIGPPTYDTSNTAAYVNDEGRYVLVKMSEAERRTGDRYRVKRFRQKGRPRTVHSNLTLAEAVAYCSGPGATGYKDGERWFYGREKE